MSTPKDLNTSNESGTEHVPPGEAAAEWPTELLLDVPFGEIYPWLQNHANERADAYFELPTRVLRVLERWRGPRWGRYLDVTPRDFLQRRNAGRGSLAAIMRGAESMADVEAPRSEEQLPATARPSGTNDHAGAAVRDAFLTDTTVITALKTIAAWGTFERGNEDIVEILTNCRDEEDVPTTVSVALAELQSMSWGAWAHSLRPRFDPWLAIRDFMAAGDPEDLRVINDRLVALDHRSMLDALGSERGVTRERLRQIEVRLAKRLRSLETNPALSRAVQRVRMNVGLAMQSSRVVSALASLGLEVTSWKDPETLVLLWLAGPYELVNDWLIRRPAKKAVDETRRALEQVTERGAGPVSNAESAVEAIGVSATEVREWIVSVGGFRIHGEDVVRWSGSISDKAEVVLRLAGSPMSRDELADRLGQGTNWRSMVNQLYADSRFKRTGLRNIGLREWEHDEYTGVADEIAQEIERQGGEASLDHLMLYVSTTYGVSQSSVRAYASGPRFERLADGLVRVRAGAPPPVDRSVEMTRGAFTIDGTWAYRFVINEQHLRGSGTPIPAAVASVMFGVEPLGAAEFQTPSGPVRVAWPTLSPHVGTIRPALERLGANEGDLVFLVPDGARLEFRHTPRSLLQELEGLARLNTEVGGPGHPDLPSIARALALDSDSTPAAVARRFRARGEDELATLVETPDEDVALVLQLSSARFVEFKISR